MTIREKIALEQCRDALMHLLTKHRCFLISMQHYTDQEAADDLATPRAVMERTTKILEESRGD